MKRRDWPETWVVADDHLVRLLAALVREEVRFDVRPEPGGWTVRADIQATGDDPTGLTYLAQSTRQEPVAA